MDKAFVGACRVGYCRVGVYRDYWNQLMKAFENLVSHNITLRKLSLRVRDSTTGWRGKAFNESTITGVLVTKGVTATALPPGLYVRLDAVLRTQYAVAEGDEVKTVDNRYYEVKAVEPHSLGSSFLYRDCHLTHLPFHE